MAFKAMKSALFKRFRPVVHVSNAQEAIRYVAFEVLLTNDSAAHAMSLAYARAVKPNQDRPAFQTLDFFDRLV
jgi:hypothetical protein